MSCFRLSLRFVAVLVFTASLVTINSARGQTAPAGTSRAELLTAAREIMASARYAALITTGANGRLNARAMDPFPPTPEMVIWFGTNPRSRKIRELRRNPRVTIYYVDPVDRAYVSIHGTARLVNDPEEKARRWKDEWKAFYPDRGKSYLLIAVTPERLEVINVKTGLNGDPITWDPHTVTFRK
jgi:general stress protein 26